MASKLFTVALLIVCLALLIIAVPAGSLAAAPEDTVSVAIVLDSSGSMLETDPEQVRLIAARMMVDLLDPGDRVAIVSFSNEGQLIAPLTEIRGPLERAALKKQLRRAAPAGDTNYRGALQLARNQLVAAPVGQRGVLFLTDGEIHPLGWDQWTVDKRKSEVRAVEDIADQLGSDGSKLFPLSFKRFLPEGSALLSTLSTRGRGFYRQIDDVSALNGAFADIYSSLKGQVFQGLSEVCSPTSKTVLPSMRRMIITMVGKSPGQTAELVPPADFRGQVETRDDDEGYYRVLIVRNPTPGEWALRPKPGQCVFVGSSDAHNVRVTPLSPSEQVSVGDELLLRAKVEQQKAGSDAWEPLEDADVTTDVTRPDVSGSMRVKMAPTGDGIYEALLEAAALVQGIYRLDTMVSRLGQVLSGIPPIPRYIEVGGFPKLDVRVTTKDKPGASAKAASGADAADKVVEAMAVLSGGQPVSNQKIDWRVLGPNGKTVSGEAAQDGQTFDFDLDMDGLYVISAILEGAIEGERGRTPFKVTKSFPVVLVRQEPQLRWMLGNHTKMTSKESTSVLPLRAAFLSGTQPVHVDNPSLIAEIVGPRGQAEEIRLSRDGEVFGRNWTIEQSGAYTLTVKGQASFLQRQLMQTDTAQLQVELAPAISLQLSSKNWGDWDDAPKRFTLQAKSNSALPIELNLSLSEPGISLQPVRVEVQPGVAQRFELVGQRGGNVSPGTRPVMLKASSPLAKVEPAELSLGSVHVNGVIEYALMFGGISLVVLGAALFAYRRVRGRAA